MCIVLMQLNHPDFALIVANNRDEFLLRPTAPSHWHSFPSPSNFEPISEKTPSLARYKEDFNKINSNGSQNGSKSSFPSIENPILSGIDVHPSGGGTWIGITRKGKLAILTNFTEQSPPPLPKDRGLESYRSRGKLPKDWLTSELKRGEEELRLEEYLNGIESKKNEWPGFNLLAGQITSTDNERVEAKIGYVSNRTKEGEGVYFLPQGQHDTLGLACAVPSGDDEGKSKQDNCCSIGLSNSVLQEPWSKVEQGRSLFQKAVRKYDESKQQNGQGDSNQLAKDLFDVLATSPGKPTDRTDLPKSILVEPQLRHPKFGWYATRTATVLLVGRNTNIDKNGQSITPLQWWERDIHIIDKDGEIERSDLKNERHYNANLFLPKIN